MLRKARLKIRTGEIVIQWTIRNRPLEKLIKVKMVEVIVDHYKLRDWGIEKLSPSDHYKLSLLEIDTVWKSLYEILFKVVEKWKIYWIITMKNFPWLRPLLQLLLQFMIYDKADTFYFRYLELWLWRRHLFGIARRGSRCPCLVGVWVEI